MLIQGLDSGFTRGILPLRLSTTTAASAFDRLVDQLDELLLVLIDQLQDLRVLFPKLLQHRL